jgi:hypothetical protein
MKLTTYICISVCSFCLGILLLGIAQEWIVILFFTQKADPTLADIHGKRVRIPIKLYRWHEGAWHTDTIDIVSTHDTQELVGQIVASWLSMAYEEQILSHPVSLQAALCSLHAQTVYLSFSDTLLNHNKSTHENLLCIESLLRTLHKNNIPDIRSCVFLVNHAPMQDAHLDFSQPWPITGFMHEGGGR